MWWCSQKKKIDLWICFSSFGLWYLCCLPLTTCSTPRRQQAQLYLRCSDRLCSGSPEMWFCHTPFSQCWQLPNLPDPSQLLPSAPTAAADVAGAVAGLKLPRRGVVRQGEGHRDADLQLWWAAGPSNLSITGCGKDWSARSEKERGWGLAVKALLKQEWGNPTELGSKGSWRKVL